MWSVFGDTRRIDKTLVLEQGYRLETGTLRLALTITLTLTDTGFAVLTLLLGFVCRLDFSQVDTRSTRHESTRVKKSKMQRKNKITASEVTTEGGIEMRLLLLLLLKGEEHYAYIK